MLNRLRSRCELPVSNADITTHAPRHPARLFGTDGVRGTAGKYPLDIPTVRRLGAALVRGLAGGRVSSDRAAAPHLLVGRDTRESGAWIEAEFAHGASGE